MNDTLTDRYVYAVTRSLPESQRIDVEQELRVSIADATDDRIAAGEAPEAAESEVLTQLGDPAVFAARYADRPLWLIGPKYYFTWWRLLKLLLLIVVPITAAGIAIAYGIAGKSIGEIIGGVIGVGIFSVAIHLCFWVTLIFAILERVGADDPAPWKLADLPERENNATLRVNAIAGSVLALILGGVLLWDRFGGLVPGHNTSILNPALWPWSFVVLFGTAAASAVLAWFVYRSRGWNTPLATANTVICVLFASFALTALGRGVLFNPEIVDLVCVGSCVEPDLTNTINVVTAVTIVGVTAWSIIDGWVRAARKVKD